MDSGSAPAADICAISMRLGSTRGGLDGADCHRLRTTLMLTLGAGRSAAPATQPSPWLIAPLPFDLTTTHRTGYALDRGNGAVWGGRGSGFALTGGATTTLGPATVTLAPVLSLSENRSFSLPDEVLPGQPRGAYPWAPAGLDWPLRRGVGPRWELFIGDSYVDVPFEVSTVVASAGVSTERLWWGPARRFPLLFGANGPGFAHAYVRTTSPLRTYAGDFQGELLWGRATESDWFDGRVNNDHRLLGAFQIRWSYEDYLPGLELALSVVRHEPISGNGLGLTNLPQLFLGDGSDEDPATRGLSLGTFAFRWAFPEEGAEVYGEIGRGDGFVNPVPGVSDTRLAQIYMLGLSKSSLDENGAGWRFSGEVVRQSLELPQPQGEAAPLPEGRRQGHTHDGALLGAWIGPGSNAQYIAIDRLDPARQFGFFAERVRRDDDTYWRVHSSAYGFRGHDVEWTLGARAGGWLDLPWIETVTGPIAVSIESGVSRRKNRNFIRLDSGRTWEFLREWNFWADLTIRVDPIW